MHAGGFMLSVLGGLAGGCLLEFAYRSLDAGRPVRPLFVNVQMYGITGAFLYLLSRCALTFALEAFLIVVFTTGIEFAVGYGYYRATGIRLWDYSGYRYNFRGFVTPRFSLYWLALGLVYLYGVLPLLVG